ncbi:MAG: lipopolysaccharide kinase InaA family protein [Candidatus Binatia bacterium]
MKDQLRPSRAFGSWRQSLGLSAAGFKAPLAIAVGAERGWRKLRREFVLTEKITGAPLPELLRRDAAALAATPASKREKLARLARLIRRFHDAGFVHGDLVAANIFVVAGGTSGVEFYFMDNDRTHRYPRWSRQTLWKRNLIQLNRMPLAGISLQDRMRFMLAYLEVERLSAADRALACWLEARTRKRRKECDGADPSLSFRRLMRWEPGTASSKDR